MNKSQKLIRSCCEEVSYLSDIKETLPSKNELDELTSIFKAISDPSRAKILFALLDYEICVGEMANLLELPQTNVSHQLKVLRKYGIVTYVKDKKMSFYKIKNSYIKELLLLVLRNVQCQTKK